MDKEIIGYSPIPDGSWEPITPCKKDYIYSAAIVSCSQCSSLIRSMGGPISGALCIDCYQSK
jgi:hypothetical protein